MENYLPVDLSKIDSEHRAREDGKRPSVDSPLPREAMGCMETFSDFKTPPLQRLAPPVSHY